MNKGLLSGGTTNDILRIFYRIYNVLGYGFLEKVCENALVLSLRESGFNVAQQKPVKVYFMEETVGDYFADIIVNDVIVAEVKAVERIHEAHEAQLLNYLRATGLEIGLLLNVGPKPEFRRRIFTNDRKGIIHG